uniref:HIT domain-containing protein n=1 Tax=Romanomermis culicivorax TaxID=13658 RepID=A0A915I0N7_ROMCU
MDERAKSKVKTRCRTALRGETMAFHDKYPIAPVHFLVIPKERITNISVTENSDSELLGRLLLTAKNCAKKLGIEENGYRIVINNGPIACQTVFHLHLHVIGGRRLSPNLLIERSIEDKNQ